MSHREILDDGSIRLATKGCSFLYTRLRPGAVLVTIAGRDTGELEDAPLAELAAEIKRYPPVDLYVDTRDTTFVAPKVSDAWTSFFTANRAQLRRVRILSSSRFVHLVIEVSKLFSRTGELIQVDADAPRFDEAIAREARASATTRARPTPSRGSQTPASARSPIQRTITRDGSLRFSNDRCAYELRTFRPGAVLITIAGHDGGEFGEIPLDEVRAEIARFGSVTFFADLRDVTYAAPSVREAWTAFFGAAAGKLSGVRIIAGSRLIQLTVGLAKEASKTGQLIKIDTDPAAFAEALAREGLAIVARVTVG